MTERFSAALCRGLIEARPDGVHHATAGRRFPRLYAAASLKPQLDRKLAEPRLRFPRLYAAASLKPDDLDGGHHLIGGFPRLYAAASLKQPHRGLLRPRADEVFRGFMPRPH